MTTIRVPRNAPTFTTPIALPSRRGGFEVRAMSKVVIAMIEVHGSATTSATSSHSGARPGVSSTAAQSAITTPTRPTPMRLR